MRRTTRRPPTLAAAAVLALGLAACGDDPTVEAPPAAEPGEAPRDTADRDGADGSAEEAAVVTMTFFDFEPGDLTVAAGTTVTWVNEDGVRHTATADDGSFDVDAPAEGDEGTHTFDEPGAFGYACEVHASMTGTITVE